MDFGDVGDFFGHTCEQSGSVVVSLVDKVVCCLGNPGCKPFGPPGSYNRSHPRHQVSFTRYFRGPSGPFLYRFAPRCLGGPTPWFV